MIKGDLKMKNFEETLEKEFKKYASNSEKQLVKNLRKGMDYHWKQYISCEQLIRRRMIEVSRKKRRS